MRVFLFLIILYFLPLFSHKILVICDAGTVCKNHADKRVIERHAITRNWATEDFLIMITPILILAKIKQIIIL